MVRLKRAWVRVDLLILEDNARRVVAQQEATQLHDSLGREACRARGERMVGRRPTGLALRLRGASLRSRAH